MLLRRALGHSFSFSCMVVAITVLAILKELFLFEVSFFISAVFEKAFKGKPIVVESNVLERVNVFYSTYRTFSQERVESIKLFFRFFS